MATATIHPNYFSKAKFTCSCGAKFEIGTTKEKLQTEVCSKCHPFYTGKTNLRSKQGQVQKFEEKMKKAEEKRKALEEIEKKRKEAYDLKPKPPKAKKVEGTKDKGQGKKKESKEKATDKKTAENKEEK